MEKRRIEDCDKEQLVRLVKMMFHTLEQEYLCLPETLHMQAPNVCIYQPTNALIDVLYADTSESPAYGRALLTYKNLLLMGIERIEKAGGKVLSSPEVVQ